MNKTTTNFCWSRLSTLPLLQWDVFRWQSHLHDWTRRTRQQQCKYSLCGCAFKELLMTLLSEDSACPISAQSDVPTHLSLSYYHRTSYNFNCCNLNVYVWLDFFVLQYWRFRKNRNHVTTALINTFISLPFARVCKFFFFCTYWERGVCVL